MQFQYNTRSKSTKENKKTNLKKKLKVENSKKKSLDAIIDFDITYLNISPNGYRYKKTKKPP